LTESACSSSPDETFRIDAYLDVGNTRDQLCGDPAWPAGSRSTVVDAV
jgi:hypothetical protein